MKKKFFGSYAVLLIWTFLIVFIIGWILYSALKTNIAIYQEPWGLPSPVTFENFYYAWFRANMGLYFANSVYIVLTSIVVCIMFSAMAAYVLARFKFLFSKVLLTFFILGMAIPYQLILIPLYVQVMNLNLINTRPGLMLIYISLWMPFTVFVLTGFFKTIPAEIEESAIMDGCNEFVLYWRIMFPLARPGIIAVAVFNFVMMWNEYMLALVFIMRRNLRTISLGMYALKDAMVYSSNWGALFAAVIIMLIPTIIIFLTLQKFVIQGLTLGAIKG